LVGLQIGRARGLPLIGDPQGRPWKTEAREAGWPVWSGGRHETHGRRFSFTLSEASRVTLAIQRAKKHRFAGFAALKKSAAQGAVSIKLSRSRALRPGLYRATLVAVDAAGNRSKPLRIR
jgi:hypothetical protein